MKKIILLAALISQTSLANKGPINTTGVEFSGQQGPCAISDVIDPLSGMEGLNCDLTPPKDPLQGQSSGSTDESR